MRGSAARQRARWALAGVAFAALAVLMGLGVILFVRDKPAPARAAVRGVATPAVRADEFSPDEQRIVALLPGGYTANACARATNPFPNAIASLDCSQTGSASPTYARFTLYNDLDALTGDFQSTTDGMVVSPCPGGKPSPGAWAYGSDPGQIGGKIICGSVEDRADIAWTRDAQLLLATVNGGPDLNSLYEWWRRYGGAQN